MRNGEACRVGTRGRRRRCGTKPAGWGQGQRPWRCRRRTDSRAMASSRGKGWQRVSSQVSRGRFCHCGSVPQAKNLAVAIFYRSSHSRRACREASASPRCRKGHRAWPASTRQRRALKLFHRSAGFRCRTTLCSAPMPSLGPSPAGRRRRAETPQWPSQH